MSQTVNFKGTPVSVMGKLPQPGDQAPAFTLVAKDLTEVTLNQFAGQLKVLNIFPSVDTGVCATSVRKFNQMAAEMDNSVVLCISADLPFAQARFCGAEGLNDVMTLSAFRSPQFLQDYGVGFTSGPLTGLTTRAVVVLDTQNKVIYSELVSETSQEPDYPSALAALKNA